MENNKGRNSTTTRRLIQDYYDDEIEFVDIISVFWRQRWFIGIVTGCCFAIAVIYVFASTPLYEITAQVSPGITDFDKDGNSVRSLSPSDIVAWFSEETYSELFEKEKTKRPPKITARIIQNTNSVKITCFAENPLEGEEAIKKTVDSFASDNGTYFKRELIVGKANLYQEIREKEQYIKSLMLDKNRLSSIEKININSKIPASA